MFSHAETAGFEPTGRVAAQTLRSQHGFNCNFVQSCPGLAPSIAIFTSDAKQLLPFSPHALSPFLEKGNLCPEKYEEFTVHLAPQIRKAFDSCRSRWNTGKSPLTALSLPGCDQNSMQQLREFSFLSKQKPPSDFLGNHELGDNANFLLN